MYFQRPLPFHYSFYLNVSAPENRDSTFAELMNCWGAA